MSDEAIRRAVRDDRLKVAIAARVNLAVKRYDRAITGVFATFLAIQYIEKQFDLGNWATALYLALLFLAAYVVQDRVRIDGWEIAEQVEAEFNGSDR